MKLSSWVNPFHVLSQQQYVKQIFTTVGLHHTLYRIGLKNVRKVMILYGPKTTGGSIDFNQQTSALNFDTFFGDISQTID